MKRGISIMAAVGLGLTCTAVADRYSDLATQGYRWVTVDGPYACTAEHELQQIAGHCTDAAELQMVENIRCYEKALATKSSSRQKKAPPAWAKPGLWATRR